MWKISPILVLASSYNIRKNIQQKSRNLLSHDYKKLSSKIGEGMLRDSARLGPLRLRLAVLASTSLGSLWPHLKVLASACLGPLRLRLAVLASACHGPLRLRLAVLASARLGPSRPPALNPLSAENGPQQSPPRRNTPAFRALIVPRPKWPKIAASSCAESASSEKASSIFPHSANTCLIRWR
jgi:hypothetical protein